MNMTDIQCFIKVTELMSFSKAAEALYISQQAVSLHIKHLETAYNVKLFERRPALKLTHSGELLLKAAHDIINRENELLDQLTTSRDNFTGEISIGLPPNRSTAFVCEFIPLFSRQYPNMTVRLAEKTSPTLSLAVKRNEIDLALPLISQYSEKINKDFLEAVPLETENLYLIIADSLLEKHFPDRFPACRQEFQKGVALEDFSQIPMFLHPSSSRLHDEIAGKLALNGTPPFMRIKTSLTSSLVSLCAQGYGIFFSTPMILKYLYATQGSCFQNLNEFPVKGFQGTRQTVLLYHKQKHLTQPIADSICIIKKLYENHRSIMDTLKEVNSRRHC